MKHRATATFWKHYEALPVEIKPFADKNFELLMASAKQPFLQLKNIKKIFAQREPDKISRLSQW